MKRQSVYDWTDYCRSTARVFSAISIMLPLAAQCADTAKKPMLSENASVVDGGKVALGPYGFIAQEL